MLATERTTTLGAGTVTDTADDWTDDNNILTDDGNTTYTVSGPGGGGAFPNNLELTNFGFNLPDDAVIDGIEVFHDGSGSGPYGSDTCNLLGVSGTTTPNTQNWSGENYYGGETELWGKSDWTAADINDSSFGVAINHMHASGMYTQTVNYLTITIYWHYEVDVDPAEVPRRYDYKAYNGEGDYLGNIPNVTSPFEYAYDINSVGAELELDVASSPDYADATPTFALGSLSSWLEGWDYRVKLTVERSKIQAGLSGFPIYVDLSDLGQHFWANVDTNGDDIRITDKLGESELPFELGDIDTATKTGYLWFRGDLSRIEHNFFYIYYGNATATPYADTDPLGANAVWGDYAGVWHLDSETLDHIGEIGQITEENTIDNGDYTSITFSRTYTNPVVVVFLATYSGVQSCIARADNVTTTGCDIFLEEPDNEPTHSTETINYMVMEAGTHTIGGTTVEAGIKSTSKSAVSGGSLTGDTVNFANTFTAKPALLHSLMTRNNGEWSHSTIEALGTTSFEVGQEMGATGHTAVAEDVGWIAFDVVGGLSRTGLFEADNVNTGANFGNDDGAYTKTFNATALTAVPLTLMSLTSRNGADGAWARGAQTSLTSTTSFQVYGEEDQVGDTERGHTAEDVATVVFYIPPTLNENPTSRVLYDDSVGLKDSSGNSHLAIPQFELEADEFQDAKFDKGVDFYRSSKKQILDIRPTSEIKPTSFPVIIEAWVYLVANPSNTFTIFQSSDWNGLNTNNSGIQFSINSSGNLSLSFGDHTGVAAGGRNTAISTGTVPTGQLVFLKGVIKGYNDFELYIDDDNQGLSLSGTATTIVNKSYFHGNIGGRGNSEFNDGIIDEVRVRTIAEDDYDAWAAAEYLNANTPTSFYNVGNFEEEVDYSDALIRNGNIIEVIETSYYYPNGKRLYKGQINRVRAKFDPSANGIIKAKLHSDGRDLDNIVARGAPFTYTDDVTQNTSNDYETVTENSKGAGWYRVGQLWVAGASNLGRIQLKLKGSADVTVSVYTTASLSSFLGSVTKTVNTGGSTSIVDFLLDFIDTESGEDYFLTVNVASGQSIQVYKHTGNPYANGNLYISSYGGGGGGSYAEQSGEDLYFVTAYGTPSTQASYTSDDPTADMLTAILDDYINQGGLVGYDSANIDATGLSESYSFNTATVFEAIEKILEMSPSGFYFYVDLGESSLYFKEASIEPDITLVKGRHVEELDLGFSIENVINKVLFSGGDTGGGDNLYSQYDAPTSKQRYGVRLSRKSDNRVTIQNTADRLSENELAVYNDEQYDTEVSVLAKTMDLTLIKPGMTVGFRGYGNFIDNLILQVIRLGYSPERAKLALGTMPVRFNTTVEQALRDILAEQTVDNPSSPS